MMETMDERLVKIYQATDYIKDRIGGKKPLVGIVLGSGLGKLAERIENPTVIPYSEIPHVVRSTAIGHKGNFIFGELGGKYVCAMQGRFHYYEGYALSQVTLPIRVMNLLGICYLFVSNAAGGLNTDFRVGDLMIIKDHINLIPNPLIGPNLDEFGTRFPDMTRPYDPGLIRSAREICQEAGIEVCQGVYLATTGPSFETPAECRYFRQIGADAVGMSTTPEVVVARHCDIPVFGMSVITNEAHTESDDEYVNDGEDVIRAADAAADTMSYIFEALISRL